jgi:hypothetical protein
MNLDQFFQHWHLTENPFRGEEARHDAVFARMAGLDISIADGAGASRTRRGRVTATHSDFEKIVGSLDQLSTAVVFGEKGSGKTAIRLQITRQVNAHNAANPDRKIFLVPYDDLNAFLDRLHKRLGLKDPAKSLDKIRLVDHIDALLSIGVGSLRALVQGGSAETRRMARRLPASVKQDWLLLNAVYGSGDDGRGERMGDATRTDGGAGSGAGLGAGNEAGNGALRRALRVRRPREEIMAWGLTLVGWVPAATALYFSGFGSLRDAGPLLGDELSAVLKWLGLALTVLWLMPMAKWQVWDRLLAKRTGRRLRKQIRVLDRSDSDYGLSLRSLPRSNWEGSHLPLTETDETRYAMLSRFTRVVRGLGYHSVMVLVDRVDEPTLVSGDPRRMKSVIWPMLNNKFLQQEGLALKMLLPIELRYELFRESSAFFQEARLDKQNLVERLSWTGSMLYDLCDARLEACREPGETGAGTKAAPVEADMGLVQAGEDGQQGVSSGGTDHAEGVRSLSLIDLFEADVTVRDIVDALDQMHQPRDAFKFLYQCISEHCSNVTAEEGRWRVPRLVLEIVRKQQSERVQALQRGIRPA